MQHLRGARPGTVTAGVGRKKNLAVLIPLSIESILIDQIRYRVSTNKHVAHSMKLICMKVLDVLLSDDGHPQSGESITNLISKYRFYR